MTKQEMIEAILDNIRENEYDSRELLYNLAEERLKAMSKKELKTYLADRK